MKQIRELYLQSASGDRWGLNGENGVYATNLSGFGVTLSPTYADLTRGFFTVTTDESEPQPTLAFTIVFAQNAYMVYQQFVDWLSAAGTLAICYNPTGAQEFFRDVNLNFLQKGELSAVGWLEVPCSFACKTPWYTPVPTTLSLLNSGVDNSKRYSYCYKTELAYGTDSSAALSCSLIGAGHIPGALDLVYYGEISNPKIRLVGTVSGTVYGICSVQASLSAGDRLTYSSRYGGSYVRKVEASGEETDLLDVLDLASAPFFRIPTDEPCTLSIEADAAFSGFADLTIYHYFRSV